MDWQVTAMDEAVVARFVRDDGAELIADETDWGLTKIEGADAPKLQVFTEDNAVGDHGKKGVGARPADRGGGDGRRSKRCPALARHGVF